MKTTAFALALLIGSAGLAQSDSPAATAYEGDGAVTAGFEYEGSAPGAYVDPTLAGTDPAGTDTVVAAATPAGALVQPSNADPERDARGIAVISAAATVPAGWNGTAAGAAMGGPELDAVTGATIAPDAYPACTAAVTDHCLQDYEVSRH